MVAILRQTARQIQFTPGCGNPPGRQGTLDSVLTLAGQVWEDTEPYRGITRESRFQLGAVSHLGPELTLDRLDGRRTLLEQIEQFRRTANALPTSVSMTNTRDTRSANYTS